MVLAQKANLTMASIDTISFYTLTNAFTGPGKFLAISTADSKTPQILATTEAPPTNAQWFLRATDVAPFYYLHTAAGGREKALDVINDGDKSTSIYLRLSDTAMAAGQFWRFDEWPSSGPYNYRLTNNFTGPDMHLDVFSDTLEPHLASGDASGQRWKAEAVLADGGTKSNTIASSPTAEATSSKTATTGPPGAAPTQASEQSGALSTGAVAGIAIGGVAALALLACAIAFFVMGARRKRQQLGGVRGLGLDVKVHTAQDKTMSTPPGYDLGAGHHPAELGGSWEQAPLVELAAIERAAGELPDQSY